MIKYSFTKDTKSMSIHQLTNACKSGAFSNMVHLTNSCINVDELVSTIIIIHNIIMYSHNIIFMNIISFIL